MNTRSDRGWTAVLVAAILVTLAAAQASSAQQNFKTLLNFDGTNGLHPYAGLAQGLNRSLYGTTYDGGDNGDGTVFKMTSTGTLTTLYSFCSQKHCTDGEWPVAGLVQGTDGNFYGTTAYGGEKGYGTVFKISPTGKLTTLHSFCSQDWLPYCTDGTYPSAGLVQATDGNFYGTTWGGEASYDGGANGDGTVFSLSVGLGPFVETVPTAGKVGEPVKILGTYLKGATSVTFNGTPAVLKRVTQTAIETSVLSGATTGTVQVVTPSGTLTSNVPFRVLQ